MPFAFWIIWIDNAVDGLGIFFYAKCFFDNFADAQSTWLGN
jgi:hypothetical protein